MSSNPGKSLPPRAQPARDEMCKLLLGNLTKAVNERGAFGTLGEWEALRAHLLEEHPAALPPYTASCTNCSEWRQLLRSPITAKRPDYAVLEREAGLHRAGHRIVLVDQDDESQRAELHYAVLEREASLHRAGHRIVLVDQDDESQRAELLEPEALAPSWVLAIEQNNGAHVCLTPKCACGQLVFTCPDCKRTSHHPDDAWHGWCAACIAFTGERKRR